ncbi:unnamed protein product [Trifolium pratense]|uniref:Uncharacterized protein n=1 Tax=Trifolium pratense TaxID=57577 RepID=A0ACB0LT40_TRIPR|nr:unnamed protein product [Trifolium pratense]
MAFDSDGWSGNTFPNKVVSKPAKVHMLKIRLHHKGYFVSDPEPAYIRGETYEVKDNFDLDDISTVTLGQLVNDLGYPPNTPLWYLHPVEGFSSGIRQLHSEEEVITFINFHKGHEYGDIFLENSNPYYAEFVEGLVEVDVGAVEEDLGEEGSDPDFRGGFDEEDSDEYDDETELDDDAEEDDHVDANSEELEFEDSDYDEDWNWANILPDVTQDLIQTSDSLRQGVEIVEATFEDFEDEDGDSEELETPDEASDEEGIKTKYPKYKEGDENVSFELEQTFATVELVRKAVKDYALFAKKNVYLEKNEKHRIVVKCDKGCSFYMRVSKPIHKSFYQVVTLEKTHTCYKYNAKNRQAKPKLLAKKFMSILRHTPNMKIRALQDEARTRWSVMLSRHQVYRAKTKALEMIEGGCIDQYKHLRSYGDELMTSNRGSTVIIKSEMGVDGPVFLRMYVCFQASKTAFVTCCRPLIGLDGCFLKGLYGGQLLTAVGKDGNNQMFPIAFAIVEAENKDSWSWFVQLLLEDLNKIQSRRWSFISDQQKGLVDTLKGIDANVEHRFCVKHLYGNWRKKYPGEQMKQSLWIAARATTVPEFERAMENMKKLNEDAWKDISQIPPSMWSRSGYSTYTQCDLQVNNMCEAFNKAILEYRDKPIISLIEGLKYYMTSRIVRLREYMLRYEGEICPMIQKRLENSKKDADNWIPMWSGDLNRSIFSVSNGMDQYVVNLKDKKCACRKWELSGIPCVHAICCLWFNNIKPEDVVAHWYRDANSTSIC